ncbi:GMC oxidoreductase [Alcanivorax sp. 1008]|uniref:GMC oxidoreductase n=1 Tax=Alcanivorax sp. 1008 TaxID=2816853 RepID=UPI001D9A2A32|nr:GMC family oxidoreductase [Alcanivorax sp. 1008]MCC1496636.1 GMC family oxidoreductase [Alcanivorax sp. 1008]
MNRREFIRNSAMALAVSPFVSIAGCGRKTVTDFAIVGSGPAGIALADKLAQAGKQVVVLEGGLRQQSEALQAMHEVEPGQWGLSYNFGWATQRMLGGTTNLWQSHSPRPHDIELMSASQRGYGVDWPITPAQLRPWLASAEAWLRIRPADPANNPDLPLNPYIESSAALRAFLQPHYQTLEAGAYGMFKRSGMDALRLLKHGEIDRVAALKTVAIHPGTTVRRILMDGRRARGLECVDQQGKALTVEAGAIIVCGGGIQTPRLLWNSAAEGIGNHSDWLGAGFMDHPGLRLYGHRDKPLLPAGAAESHLHVRDMLFNKAHHGLGGTLLRIGLIPGPEGSEYTLIESLFEQAPEHSNRIVRGASKDALGDPLPKMHYRLSDLDKATIALGQRLQRTLAEQLGGIDSASPFRHSSHHLCGATRMAKDPADGVVNTDLQVWGTDNLYIAGSSVFPTSTTVPPTLILTALAQRLADHLINNPA